MIQILLLVVIIALFHSIYLKCDAVKLSFDLLFEKTEKKPDLLLSENKFNARSMYFRKKKIHINANCGRPHICHILEINS